MAHHVPWLAAAGPWVLINALWHYTKKKSSAEAEQGMVEKG